LRRLMVAWIVGALLALTTAGPAWAKLPPFTVQLSTTVARSGKPVNVTVRFWNDRRHTKPATWWVVRRIPHLLWVVPMDARASAEVDTSIPITVRRTGPAAYRGTVTLTTAGSYLVVPFSVDGGFDAPAGYPKPIVLDVAAPSPAEPATGGSGARPWLPGALVAGLGIAVLGALAVRRARGGRARHAAA
jgi:hypothetical protein